MPFTKSIGIDYDDVKDDYARALLIYFNQKFPNRRMKLNHLTSFNLQHILGFSTPEQYHSFMGQFERSRTRKKTKSIQGANNGILDLVGRGHNLVLITDSGVDQYERVQARLQKDCPGCFREIHFTHLYPGGSISKSQICLEGDIELMIDDNLDTLRDCANQGIKGILFSRPWNTSYSQLPDLVQRANSWDEILRNEWLRV
ncbi:hypothetical protein J4467_01410 [Candidatus Woesearchaeota archaeon]|nr:hypothetical protein [Candidatus Woesearchaeota archaeon]